MQTLWSTLKKLWWWFAYKLSNSDPHYKCEYHKDNFCVHVDGPLCDYPDCIMNKEYIDRKKNEKHYY